MSAVRYDVAIIGGGIVGLATAMEAVRLFPRLRLLVLEKEPGLAAHQSGHNSGVIHSGIYYRPGSVKAATCVEGGRRMLAFCRAHELPHSVCGKVVVATRGEETPALDELLRRGAANGVPGLAIIGPERLREIEPRAAGVRALHVPGTAITDYAAVTRKFGEVAAAAGVAIRTSARVTGLAQRDDGIVLQTVAGDFQARLAINCGGLYSDRIARMSGVDPGLIIVPFRGEYYELAPARRRLVRGLIYPVPDPVSPFLGVHFTPRVDGRVEAGPNAVLAFRREGYRRFDFNLRDTVATLAFRGFRRMAARHWRRGLGELGRSFSKRAFVRDLRRLVPDVRPADLVPGGSGVRAQALDPSGALVDDFRFFRTGSVIHVLNVPSPAATASIAIGARIADLAARAL